MNGPPLSFADLSAALRSGVLEPQGHLAEVQARVEARESTVQALLPEQGRFERLRREAAALAEVFPTPAVRPFGYCVPVAVKDIYAAAGFETRAGSALPPEEFLAEESPVVTALRESGCLILGKSHTTEFAYFEPGPTRNPVQPEHTPGGSSSGSAAAVAAGYCSLALGSQTVGSVIRPAAFCGVAGFKTSYGRVSLENVVPYAPSTDHFGFFTGSPADLPLALALFLRPGSTSSGGRRLGIPSEPYLRQAEEPALAEFRRQVERLRDLGWDCREVPALEDVEEINRRHNRLCCGEMARVHARWFERYAQLYRSRTAAWIREGMGVSDEEVRAAARGGLLLREQLHAVMDQEGLDAWLSPAACGPAPRGLGSTGDPAMNLPWTHAGLPVAGVPAGRLAGLPLGLQLAGRFGADEQLAILAAILGACFPAGGSEV